MDEQDERRHPWAPPGGSPWAAGTPVAAPDGPGGPDADGPPPPPWVRRRRRRRRVIGIVAVVALLVAVPVGLLWAGVFDRGDGGTAQNEVPDREGPDVSGPTDPEPEPDPDASLEAPDPDQFSGSDADFAAVLRGVEASEQVMLRFQSDIAEAYALGGTDDPDPFFAAVQSAAETGATALADARADLEEPVATDAAEEVREVYLDHLDAWLALMEATADDPTLFGPGGDTARFDVEINATALDFSRTLESSLPEDAADEITRFAERLLDRGFRFDDEAQV